MAITNDISANGLLQGGSSLAGGIIGGIVGAVEGKKNREHQIEMQEKQIKANAEAQQRQYQLNEMAAGKSDARARALFRDFETPEARRKQLEEAGLSVGLMYSGAGAGTAGHIGQGAQGSTGIASTGGASGNPYNMAGNIQAGAQAALALSEVQLMKSEANKNNAEADRLRGEGPRGEAEVEEINTRIENFIEEAKNKRTQNGLIEVQKRLANAESALAEAKAETENQARAKIIESYTAQNEKAWSEITELTWRNWITQEQAYDIISSLRIQNRKSTAELAQIKANVKLTSAQTEKIANEIELIQREIITEKWRGINEEGLYERWRAELEQSAEFKDMDITQDQWKTLLQCIFSIAGIRLVKKI